MNDTTQTPVAPLTLRQRVAAWWAELDSQNRFGLFMLAVVSAIGLAAVLIEGGQKPAPKREATQPAAVQTTQIAPLVARIEALEAQVADLQDRQPATAPRAIACRGRAAVPTAAPWPASAPQPPAPQPPALQPAPITRQTVDQFRASLRTTLPNQE